MYRVDVIHLQAKFLIIDMTVVYGGYTTLSECAVVLLARIYHTHNYWNSNNSV